MTVEQRVLDALTAQVDPEDYSGGWCRSVDGPLVPGLSQRQVLAALQRLRRKGMVEVWEWGTAPGHGSTGTGNMHLWTIPDPQDAR